MSAFEPDTAQPNGLEKIGTALAGTITSGFAFNANNERGAINSMFIRNLTADVIQSGTLGGSVLYGGTISGNQINGGTITLGGTSNGDGLLVVKTSGGSEVVRLDNNGITISQGSITNVTVVSTNVQSGTIGTASIIGGTVEPGLYKFAGSPGVSGTFTYLNAATIPGTIIVLGGIITSIT